jgi:hypothetical protein
MRTGKLTMISFFGCDRIVRTCSGSFTRSAARSTCAWTLLRKTLASLGGSRDGRSSDDELGFCTTDSFGSLKHDLAGE